MLEERGLAGRQRQYNAIALSRLWTRLMGFIAGMVMVLAGSVFILGKLEAEFDGSGKLPQGEGAVKTNSPGLVLVVAGTIHLAISLVTTVEVESTDRLLYLPALQQPARQPTGAVTPNEGSAPNGSECTGNKPSADCKPKQ